MGGNSLEGHPLIYPSTIPKGNLLINPIPQWSGHVLESNQYFWIQPPQGGNIPWNSNQNQGHNQWNGWVLVSNQSSWDPTPSGGNPPSGQVLGSNQSSWKLTQ